MKQIFLHIGLHKTGTTAIQRFLSANRDALADTGVLYPVAGQRSDDPHAQHLLAPSIARQMQVDCEEVWQKLTSEIEMSSADKVVVSTEGLCLSDTDEVARIRHHLAGMDVRILICFRNQLDLMLSRYKQQIKSQKTSEGAREFFQTRLDYCDYRALVDRWVSEFGADRVDICCYERVCQEPGLIRDFVQRTGVSMEVPDVERRANVSPDDRASLLLLSLNRHPLVNRSWVGRRLRRHLMRMTKPGRTVGMIAAPFLPSALVSDEDQEWLRTQLQPLADAFVKTLGDADRPFFSLSGGTADQPAVAHQA